MSTAQNYAHSNAHAKETASPVTAPNPRLEYAEELLCENKNGLVAAVSEFFDQDWEGETAVGSLSYLLNHWLTTEYKSACRDKCDEDLSGVEEGHLSRMLSTISLLGMLKARTEAIAYSQRRVKTLTDQQA